MNEKLFYQEIIEKIKKINLKIQLIENKIYLNWFFLFKTTPALFKKISYHKK